MIQRREQQIKRLTDNQKKLQCALFSKMLPAELRMGLAVLELGNCTTSLALEAQVEVGVTSHGGPNQASCYKRHLQQSVLLNE